MNLSIDGSNSISGGAIAYLSNLLKYAEPEKYGIRKVKLYGYKKLLENIEDRPWLEKIYEPELDKGIPHRLKWLWFKFPKLVKDSDLVFLPGANYVKIEIPYVSLCHNILPFVDFRKIYKFSRLTLINECRKFSQSRCFENAKGVIFLSNYAKNIVIKKLKKVPEYIEVIPHGIPERFFNPPKNQKDISEYTKEKPFKFLYVSAIRTYKYQWNVVRAFFILNKKNYPVTITFVGPILDEFGNKHFKEFIIKYDPENTFVNYLGNISYDKIHEIYRNYDAFIFASIYETFGIPLLEAMASGLPIACSDFELTREILSNDAVYFDPRNPESIAEAVIRLIEDKDLREKFAWENFKKAEKYTWEKCVEKTMAFFKLAF